MTRITMKKVLFFAIATLAVGCTNTDKVTKNTINQEEVMSKMSFQTKAHDVMKPQTLMNLLRR